LTVPARSLPAPIATEVLQRIAELYQIEAEIRGQEADARQAVRQQKSKPLIEALKTWLEKTLPQLPRGSSVAQAIRYGFNQWEGLLRFLDDGRIEIDSNSVERAMRPIALNRKNALFAGSDEGAENWAMLASWICCIGGERRAVGGFVRSNGKGGIGHRRCSRRVVAGALLPPGRAVPLNATEPITGLGNY
jgi:hypothetical protein